jgi:putative nucleotidyltransferase with HDIG domain
VGFALFFYEKSLSHRRMTEPAPLKIPRTIEVAIENMPSISPIFNKIKEMARKIEVPPADIVKVIMTDPVLTAKVIKLVNSSFYSLKEPVHSLAEAVLFLGINTVKNLAMSSAVLERIMVGKNSLGIDPREFWRHCLATAVGTRMLAKIQGVPSNDLEVYFLAGLLHDLGKVIFIQAMPDVYERALTDCREKSISLFLCETERMGASHGQVGGLLARKWKLETVLIEAIELHHQPESLESSNHVLKMVILANNFCKQAGLGGAGNSIIESWIPELIQKESIDPTAIPSIIERLPAELQRAADFLGIAAPK